MEQRVRRPRIADVAREAGVSKTAVSFAFNSPDRLSLETANRIRDVAHTLGYRPHPVARIWPFQQASQKPPSVKVFALTEAAWLELRAGGAGAAQDKSGSKSGDDKKEPSKGSEDKKERAKGSDCDKGGSKSSDDKKDASPSADDKKKDAPKSGECNNSGPGGGDGDTGGGGG